MDKMLKRLKQERSIQTAAYVRKAYSAAAIFSMACPTVVMAPDAAIGAAVKWEPSPWGTPQNIDEKFQSMWRAQCRASTQDAGHEPLLAEGMIRTDISLVRTGLGRSAKIAEMDAPVGAGVVLLKPKGKILTLTAQEALDCGLAFAVSDTPNA